MTDETFHKYPKIKAFGDDENKDILADPEDIILIEEKIDGGNFRFMVKDGNIIFGSRTQEIDLDSKNAKNFKRCANFVREALTDCDLKLLEHRIYYGECCVKHTMSYDWEKIPPFLGFDIFCLAHQKFLMEKDQLFAAMNLPTVPRIRADTAKVVLEEWKKMSLGDVMNDAIVPKSAYASPSSKEQQAEGIVIKNYSKQLFAKYVREKFKEANKEAFGESKRFAKDDTERIVAVYCTNARIDKHIFKLVDEGEKLEMQMMHKLPNAVFRDIFEEHWEEIIIKGKPVIDFGELKKTISKRCLAVLKQVITNNALVEQ